MILKKKIGLWTASILFVLSLSFIVYHQISKDHLPDYYAYDIKTDDFSIKNIGLVAYQHSTYVDGSYYLQRHNPDKNFEGISLVTKVHGDGLFSFAQADDPFKLPNARNGNYYFAASGALHDIKIRPSDKMQITVNYTVDGIKKTYDRTVFLRDLISRPSLPAEVILQ